MRMMKIPRKKDPQNVTKPLMQIKKIHKSGKIQKNCTIREDATKLSEPCSVSFCPPIMNMFLLKVEDNGSLECCMIYQHIS